MIYNLRLLKNNYTKEYFIIDIYTVVFSIIIDVLMTWGLLSLLNEFKPIFQDISNYQHLLVDPFFFDFLFLDFYALATVFILIIFVTFPFIILCYRMGEHLYEIKHGDE